ncbi:hypothetical protein [Rickettsiella massiliensis]|uniref:hypothetical protein n=1 Tax=Rickettsiella massiliensis TaxID=676517 RepID=UPI000299E52D|nr:hypothetical protein [Rickettsiella massiliensis]
MYSSSQSNNCPLQPTRYIPIPSWEKYHDWPKVGGLRNLIFYRHKNGFDKVIKRVGGRVLIDEAAFYNWVNERNKEDK